MDALVDGHYRAEEARDIDAIVDGLVPGAEHDVAGRPGDELRGREQIAGYYRALLAALRIERFEPVRRWHGDRHVVDESILHGTAVGRVSGLDGRGRDVHVRLLHVFRLRRRPDQPRKRLARRGGPAAPARDQMRRP